MAVRFGLFGTGYWAAEVHAAALRDHQDCELVGVWGRNPAKAAALASRYGCVAYADADDLIADVEAVDIALPPDIQAPLATAAAMAGRHLLLEKPLALTGAAADRVVATAEGTGAASVVFFTARFVPATAQWLAQQTGKAWQGGSATWLGSVFEPGSPFAHSPWRQQYGGLWDLGPHALSIMVPLLGPIDRVLSAARDRDGTVRFLARHESGATSVQTVGLSVPPAAVANRLEVYGPDGWAQLPAGDIHAVNALGEALSQLVRTIADGRSDHPCDVRFGAHIVHVLEQAQQLLG